MTCPLAASEQGRFRLHIDEVSRENDPTAEDRRRNAASANREVHTAKFRVLPEIKLHRVINTVEVKVEPDARGPSHIDGNEGECFGCAALNSRHGRAKPPDSRCRRGA